MSDNKFPRPNKGIIEVCEDSPLAISFYFDWEIRDWCEKVRKRLEEIMEENGSFELAREILEMLKC